MRRGLLIQRWTGVGVGCGGEGGESGVPEGWELGAELAQLVFLAAEQGHKGALGGEAGGDRGADAAVCAGDEGMAGAEGEEDAGHCCWWDGWMRQWYAAPEFVRLGRLRLPVYCVLRSTRDVGGHELRV